MVHYLDHENNGQGLDMEGVITRECICGGTWFKTIVTIGDDYTIAAYGLDGECVECGTRVKIPCPADLDTNPPV